MTTTDKALVAAVREVAQKLRGVGRVSDGMMSLPERLVIPRTVPMHLEMAAARLEQLLTEERMP